MGKQCRKCGSPEHLAAECDAPLEKLSTACGCCRESGHASKECKIRREEEKIERVNYRNSKKLQIRTAWQERSDHTKKMTDQKSNQEPQTSDKQESNQSTKDATKIYETVSHQITKLLAENQKQWQNDMKEMME